MKKIRGVYTAIITPFAKNQTIDWDAFEVLVERQISAKVDGIVFSGTTGESPTLSHEEHEAILEWSVKKVNKKVHVIHSVGSKQHCRVYSIFENKSKTWCRRSYGGKPVL